MSNSDDQPGFIPPHGGYGQLHLTDFERLALAEELIASVRNPEALEAPLAHRIELERRWRAYEENPSIALSPEQFWAQVDALKR